MEVPELLIQFAVMAVIVGGWALLFFGAGYLGKIHGERRNDDSG